MWSFDPSRRFKSSYKKLHQELRDRVDDALKTLASNPEPERLGIFKKNIRARIKGCYAFELGRSCRILYFPDYGRRIILLLRVCSHKEWWRRESCK